MGVISCTRGGKCVQYHKHWGGGVMTPEWVCEPPMVGGELTCMFHGLSLPKELKITC